MQRRDFLKIVASTFALVAIPKAAKVSLRPRDNAFDLEPGECSLIPWQSGMKPDDSTFAIGDRLNLSSSCQAVREPVIDAVTGIPDPYMATIRAGKTSLMLNCSGRILTEDFGTAITNADNLLLTVHTKSGAMHSMNVSDVRFDVWMEAFPHEGQVANWEAGVCCSMRWVPAPGS